MPLSPVLYITYDGLTDPLGPSQILPYLSGLVERGHGFHIISCEKPENFAKYEGKIRELLAKDGMTWHPIPYTKRPPVLSTVIDMLRLWWLCCALHKQHRFVLVHCRSYLPGLLGRRLRRRFGIPFLFDMRGFWADERTDRHIWNKGRLLYRLIYRFFKGEERQMLARADAVVCLTHRASFQVHEWGFFPSPPPPVRTIPCCADEKLFQPAMAPEGERTGLRRELGIAADDLVLMYLGSLGTCYLLNDMLRFYARLLQQEPGARFLFITRHPPEEILEPARRLQIPVDRIIIRGGFKTEMPLLISLADVSISFFGSTFSIMASSPTKIAETLFMGVPVIVNRGIGDLDQIITDGESGLLVDNLSDAAFDRTIARLDLIRHTPADAIISRAREVYSLEQGVSAYAGLYDELATRAGPPLVRRPAV